MVRTVSSTSCLSRALAGTLDRIWYDIALVLLEAHLYCSRYGSVSPRVRRRSGGRYEYAWRHWYHLSLGDHEAVSMIRRVWGMFRSNRGRGEEICGGGRWVCSHPCAPQGHNVSYMVALKVCPVFSLGIWVPQDRPQHLYLDLKMRVCKCRRILHHVPSWTGWNYRACEMHYWYL